MIAGLRTFNQDTLNFYRESASGINKLAYFIAKDLSDVSNTARLVALTSQQVSFLLYTTLIPLETSQS